MKGRIQTIGTALHPDGTYSVWAHTTIGVESAGTMYPCTVQIVLAEDFETSELADEAAATFVMLTGATEFLPWNVEVTDA